MNEKMDFAWIISSDGTGKPLERNINLNKIYMSYPGTLKLLQSGKIKIDIQRTLSDTELLGFDGGTTIRLVDGTIQT